MYTACSHCRLALDYKHKHHPGSPTHPHLAHITNVGIMSTCPMDASRAESTIAKTLQKRKNNIQDHNPALQTLVARWQAIGGGGGGGGRGADAPV